MTTVKVYQIGCGDFGRFGFEKLVELHRHLEEPDVELAGLAEPDFDEAEDARKFAAAHDVDVETFKTAEEMYEAASREEGRVMVYDAGPSNLHADHVYESLKRGFFHLAEKPPSLTREQHLREKRLAREYDVAWKVDFIERESPVVKKAEELLKGKKIDRIEVFRESPVGVEKLLNPVERSGVVGGDVLDKMVHEVYLLDFLEAAGIEPSLDLVDAESRYMMPKDFGSEKLMSVNGGYTEEVDDSVATGQTRAELEAGSSDIVLHSSWLGISDEAMRRAEHIREETGHLPIDVGFQMSGDTAYEAGESRFFVVRGDRDLVGDMLHRKLFDLDTGEEIPLPDLMHDQLYRVLENSVRNAAGEDVYTTTEKEIDAFMNALFDVREAAVGNAGPFLDELEEGLERVDEMVAGSVAGFEEQAEKVAG